ncbi:MAG TPA: hypothetical protein VGE30_00965 [Candidatus Saccharimonadales bacterium]
MPGRQERMMRGDYELIGNPVAPLNLEISQEAAQDMHDYVARDFLPGVMHASPDNEVVVRELTETSDVTKMATSFGRNSYYSPDLDVGGFFGLRLTHTADESWKLRAMKSRYHHDGTPNRIMVRYLIDVMGGRLMQAKRVVQIIRTHSDDVFAKLLSEGDLDEPIKPQFKMYERPLNPQDCDALKERIATGLRRKQAIGR